jgi:hypothetical protein
LSGKDAVIRRKMMKKNSGFLVMFSVMVLVFATLMGACEDSESVGDPESAPEEREVYIDRWKVTTEAGLNGAIAEINGRSEKGNYLIALAGDIEITGKAPIELGDLNAFGKKVTDPDTTSDPGVPKTTVIRGNGELKITSKNDMDGSLFIVTENNTLVLENVTLAGGESSGYLVHVSGGTLVMKAGSKITKSKGDGVVIHGGAFTMEGGVISENKAQNYVGGGVSVAGGEFKMTGGTISGNSGVFGGGGVFVDEGSTFTMENGTISGNTAGSVGGGVYVENNSIFTKSGGTLYGYPAPDDSDSNIVGTREGENITVGSGRGHAVCVGIRPDDVDLAIQNIFKICETTAGPEDVLSYDGTKETPTVSEGLVAPPEEE